MFLVALFTIAKTRKQSKCLSTVAGIKKLWYIHTMGYYSAIKENKIMPFAATWMDQETIHTDGSKSGQDIYHLILLICGI